MKRFVYLYSGLDRPTADIPAEYLQLWMAYFAKLGPALVDHGAPFQSEGRALGTASGDLNIATGYSVIQAASLDAAVALTEGHPMLIHGGGVTVLECIDLSGALR